jgi:hypothetical protein
MINANDLIVKGRFGKRVPTGFGAFLRKWLVRFGEIIKKIRRHCIKICLQTENISSGMTISPEINRNDISLTFKVDRFGGPGHNKFRL